MSTVPPPPNPFKDAKIIEKKAVRKIYQSRGEVRDTVAKLNQLAADCRNPPRSSLSKWSKSLQTKKELISKAEASAREERSEAEDEAKELNINSRIREDIEATTKAIDDLKSQPTGLNLEGELDKFWNAAINICSHEKVACSAFDALLRAYPHGQEEMFCEVLMRGAMEILGEEKFRKKADEIAKPKSELSSAAPIELIHELQFLPGARGIRREAWSLGDVVNALKAVNELLDGTMLQILPDYAKKAVPQPPTTFTRMVLVNRKMSIDIET
jgi:hypothetical protein